MRRVANGLKEIRRGSPSILASRRVRSPRRRVATSPDLNRRRRGIEVRFERRLVSITLRGARLFFILADNRVLLFERLQGVEQIAMQAANCDTYSFQKGAGMTEGTAALFGALIGATAGLAGGSLAAVASLRASQLAARAPLGPILHEIGNALIAMNATKGTEEYWTPRREFERRWNEFAVQQRILCPSERIAALMDLVLAVARNESDSPQDLMTLAGQTIEKVTRMVGAYGNFLFRCRARREEARIIRRWLDSKQAEFLGATVRTKLAVLGSPKGTLPGFRRLSVLAAILGSTVISLLWLTSGAPTESQFIFGTLVFVVSPAIFVLILGRVIANFQ